MTQAPPPGGQPGSGPPQWQQPAGPDPRTGVPTGQGGAATALRPGQAPTRSNRAVILTILIAVLVIGGGASAWLLSTPGVDRSTPRGAAEAFASAVNDRDLDALGQVICSKDRSELRSRGRIVEVLSQITVRVTDVESQGDKGTATFSVTAIFGDVGPADAPLERDADDGLWTVCLPDGLGT